jgi:hypothetical protein
MRHPEIGGFEAGRVSLSGIPFHNHYRRISTELHATKLPQASTLAQPPTI